jgi:hypothetical protein
LNDSGNLDIDEIQVLESEGYHVLEKKIQREIILVIKERMKEILNTVNVIGAIVDKTSPTYEVANCIRKAMEGENAIAFITEDFVGSSILLNNEV